MSVTTPGAGFTLPVSAAGNGSQFDISKFQGFTVALPGGSGSYGAKVQVSVNDAPAAALWQDASPVYAVTALLGALIPVSAVGRLARVVIVNYVSGNPAADGGQYSGVQGGGGF